MGRRGPLHDPSLTLASTTTSAYANAVHVRRPSEMTKRRPVPQTSPSESTPAGEAPSCGFCARVACGPGADVLFHLRRRPSGSELAKGNGIQDTDRLRKLQALTDAALAHLELDALLSTLLVRVREVLGVDTCAVLLLDEEANELVARAAVGIEEEVERGVRIPVGGGFAGRVAADRQPVVLEDVDHADVLNPILREKGIKSMLGVPLLVAAACLAFSTSGCLVHRVFDDDDVELLQLAGDRASIAIEHARAFEAERLARRQSRACAGGHGCRARAA